MNQLIAERAATFAEMARELCGPAPQYPTNPAATAAALTFVEWLCGYPPANAVPLEELVTPDTLQEWRTVLADPDTRADLLDAFGQAGVAAPRVRPRADGSVVVVFPWMHPDQQETVCLTSRAEVEAHTVVVRLVDEPDDWRVSAVDPPRETFE